MSFSLAHPDVFARRHIGPSAEDQARMLETLRVASLEALVAETVPASIRMDRPIDLPPAISEAMLLEEATRISSKNKVLRSYLGMGYSDCVTPPVILRNIVQNPGWYTQYTPYQAEISQGRLEALLNYQTVVTDLTGLPVANASLLDEGTAAAEAMHLAYEFKGNPSDGSAERTVFFVSSHCHPQTIDVVRTRAEALGIRVEVGDEATADLDALKPFGVLAQYPRTDGVATDLRPVAAKVQKADALFVVATDLLALAVLAAPGELGADVAVGNSQRFGVPLGYGGPHAAFFACKTEYVRKLPGRIIGVSEDAQHKPALRMALQTREQHIRREKATSNICTAQALLAIVASMYAVYHGPVGVRAIAERAHRAACALRDALTGAGITVSREGFFDTIRVDGTAAQCDRWISDALGRGINLRRLSATSVTVALDETVSERELVELCLAFGVKDCSVERVSKLAEGAVSAIPEGLRRTSAYLSHPVFNQHHSETEMLRYMRKLEGRDLSLAHSMIPLGSCTMKLNATAEMMPITDPAWNRLHPFVPVDQAQGYQQVFAELSAALAEITGLPGVSLQPNSGAQGEYAGLLVIKGYLDAIGQSHRTVCLIPSSAHGTNPASAVMAGLEVVVVKTDAHGNIDVEDLEAKARLHAPKLAALMVTYPSTHGVFEESIKRVCAIIHSHGGQVYMDGANMNAQVGLCRPGDIGADVVHINLHKTFSIPHGGGGPGMGPICVAAHLAKHLPAKPVVEPRASDSVGAVSAAPWGSSSVLLISWAYIKMMGGEGLTRATMVAILNANYIATRLSAHYPVVYVGTHGRVAHECILDLRHFKKTAGVEVEDVAKRLMDYGFHAPTMSWPIAGTLMVEPTESESMAELDRFCDAMISIRAEIAEIEAGRMSREDNALKNAPHSLDVCLASEWRHPYTREQAAFPSAWTRDRKFWPFVGRVNNALGDRKLVCTCPPIEAYGQA
jgi:glycine dehydrogenase